MRSLLITCSFVAFCGVLRAQFTTFTASADFVTSPSNSYGLDSSSISGQILQVKVVPNDLSYVGRINVLIYDSISESPMNMISISRADIQTGAPVDNDAVVFNFPWFTTGISYKIVVEAQNFQLGYLPNTAFYFRED